MKKREAIYAMKQGKKLTHINFSNEEWVTAIAGNRYVFEDNNICDADEFWAIRTSDSWKKNWSIFEPLPVRN